MVEMVEVVINKRTINVIKPHWTSNPPEMSLDLLSTLTHFRTWHRHIQKIIIEVDKPTEIRYFILPNRWIGRLYDNGMLRRGTL